MEPVYGRKRLGTDAGRVETWMDRFTQLEPSGGFGAVVQQVWNHSAMTSSKAALVSSLNGSMNGKPAERAIRKHGVAAIRSSQAARISSVSFLDPYLY